MKRTIYLTLAAVLLASMLAGCSEQTPSDPDVTWVTMARNPVIDSGRTGSFAPLSFEDIPRTCADVIMIEPIGIVQDGAAFDSFYSLVKGRVIKSYAGDFDKDDDVLFFVTGTSELVLDYIPISTWQKAGSRYITGLQKSSVDLPFDDASKSMFQSFGFNTIYFAIMPYEVVAINGIQYVRTMWSGNEYSEINHSREINVRAGDAAIADENAQKAVINQSKKNAVSFEIVFDDSAVVTLEAWENAIASFSSNEWREVGKWYPVE
jgi:hypothetical protein